MVDYCCCPLFPKEVAEYLNSYPAFQTTYGYMNNDFFVDMHMVEQLKKGNRITKRYAECAGLTTKKPFTMEEARGFLEWIDPLWCLWNGVKSSGFNFGNEAIPGSFEFLDDNLMEI